MTHYHRGRYEPSRRPPHPLVRQDDDNSSPSRYATENRKVVIPLEDREIFERLSQWVTQGDYDLGSPEDWVKYPDPIQLQVDVNDSYHFPSTPRSHKNPTAAWNSSRNQVNTPTTVNHRQRTVNAHRPRNARQEDGSFQNMRSSCPVSPASSEHARRQRITEKSDEVDTNNCNTMSESDYVLQTDFIKFADWVLCYYPVIKSPQPNNEDCYLEDGEVMYSP